MQKTDVEKTVENRNRLTDVEKTYGYQRGNIAGRDKSEAWDEHAHTLHV